MNRKIIIIDEEKCNGCGLCAEACHEGAISIIDGKAKLIREDYCDGLGDCLPSCPTKAISFEVRDAKAYDEVAVKMAKQFKTVKEPFKNGCPGNKTSSINRDKSVKTIQTNLTSQLSQWPIQIKLVPINAPYFAGARLLIAADCTAYAYANFHNDFIKNHITLIGCPKLDNAQYVNKLTEIISNNDIKSVSVVRMEVPCCGGIENAVKEAIKSSGKFLPWNVVTISIDGNIID